MARQARKDPGSREEAPSLKAMIKEVGKEVFKAVVDAEADL
jgi:hypothetical protein